MHHLLLMSQAAGIDFAVALTYLFLAGASGCVIVLILSFYEDAKVILGYE